MKRLWDRLPDSLSATVYGMRHGWLWTLLVWTATFTAMPLMLSRSEGTQGIIAFLACACLGFVGAMPLVKGRHNTLHNALGISAGILSQAWALTRLDLAALIIAWSLYLAIGFLPRLASFDSHDATEGLSSFWLGKWCLAAELLCIGTVAWAVAR